MRRGTGEAPSQLVLPSAVAWRLDEAQAEIRAEVSAQCLSENIQGDDAAAVAFLLGATYWLGQESERSWTAHLVIDGEVGDDGHARRSRFVLGELAGLLPDRLRLSGVTPWTVPADAVVNSPGPRVTHAQPTELRTEHDVEVHITLNGSPLGPLRRQFPLGVFRGVKSNATRALPGGGAQIDLWGRDGDTLHIVELKKPDEVPLGILTEALLYLLLIHRLRESGARWHEEWEGARAVQETSRSAMWLACTRYHPLLSWHGRGPLEWLEAPLAAERMSLRRLPYSVDPERPALRWDASAVG